MPLQPNQLDKTKVASNQEQASPPVLNSNEAAFSPIDDSGTIRPFFSKKEDGVQVDKRLAFFDEIGQGGGATTLDGLTDTTLNALATGQFLSWNGTSWVNVAAPSGGGGATNLDDLGDVSTTGKTAGQVLTWNGSGWVASTVSGGATSISDVAYDATTWDADTTNAPSKNAVRDQLEAMLGLISGNASAIGLNDTDISNLQTSVSSIVQASGSIDTHSDVSTGGKTLGQFLRWNGTSWEAASLTGGGDLVSTNNLTDVADAATALSNLGGLAKADVVSKVDAEAGTSTVVRAWSSLRVKEAILALAPAGGGGSGVGTEVKIELGAGATIADKVANAPVGGIPAGMNIYSADDSLNVNGQLSGSVNDIVVAHNLGGAAVLCYGVKTDTNGFGGVFSIETFNAGELKTEDTTLNQTRLLNFNTAVGNEKSILVMKIIPFL